MLLWVGMLISSFDGSQVQLVSGRKEFGSIDVKVVFFKVAVGGVLMKTSEAYFMSVASLQRSGITNVLHFRIASPLGIIV